MRIRIVVILFLLQAGIALSDVTVQRKGWMGWDGVYNLSNGIVQARVSQHTGGRIVEFFLGSDNPYWLNSWMMEQKNFNEWMSDTDNLGGTRFWPMPQSDWNWPPPPVLDHGNYSHEIVHQSADSAVLHLESPVENERTGALGLQFKRTLTIYKASSRIRIRHCLVNKGTGASKRGIRQVNQMQPHHKDEIDFDQFNAYFAKGSGVSDSAKGYTVLRGGESMTAKVQVDDAAGVVRVNGVVDGMSGMVGAHSSAAWTAWVDERDGYAFVMTAGYDPRGEYPDQNSNVIIYVDGKGTFVEVEMQSAMTELDPGDSLLWETNICRSASRGPVLAVNTAGMTRKRLAVDENRITGSYGVFHAGRLDLVLAPGATVALSREVSPVSPVELDTSIDIPGGTATAYLVLYKQGSTVPDTLDHAAAGPSRTVTGLPAVPAPPVRRRLAGNRLFVEPHAGQTVRIHRMDGSLVHPGAPRAAPGEYRLDRFAPGTFLAVINGPRGRAVARFAVAP